MYGMLFAMNAYIHSLVTHVQKVASGKREERPARWLAGWLADWRPIRARPHVGRDAITKPVLHLIIDRENAARCPKESVVSVNP